MQAKRIQVDETTGVVAGQVGDAFLLAPTEPREEINYHNIWGSASVVPVNADANCRGTWVLYVVKSGGARIPWTDITVNAEINNFFVIACGVFHASNQTPYGVSVNPKTSRTLNPNDQLVMSLTIQALTAGSAVVRTMICAHTTRK